MKSPAARQRQPFFFLATATMTLAQVPATRFRKERSYMSHVLSRSLFLVVLASMVTPTMTIAEQWEARLGPHTESQPWVKYGAVNGWSESGIGVKGHSGFVSSSIPSNAGVAGDSTYGPGVYGTSTFTDGVQGVADSDNKSGIFAVNDNANGYAGYFRGRVHVTGYLAKPGGGFKIDHPLDPENRYLHHSFVESPDMMNVYNGNVVLDVLGEAWVELPEWFEALNRDFRYQLTPIGGFAPLYISQEVMANRFRIAGGTPGLKVSWQITGIRQDPWAEAHRIPVEQDKPDIELGTYLHPAEWQQPSDLDVQWVHRPELMERNEARWAERR